jgi:hypothetical protein
MEEPLNPPHTKQTTYVTLVYYFLRYRHNCGHIRIWRHRGRRGFYRESFVLHLPRAVYYHDIVRSELVQKVTGLLCARTDLNRDATCIPCSFSIHFHKQEHEANYI